MRWFLAICFCFFISTRGLGQNRSIAWSVGAGTPQELVGSRLAYRSAWPWTLANDRITLTGYWDTSVAYWHTEHPDRKINDTTIVAAAPVFRITGNLPWPTRPFFEASVGLSLHTTKQLASRDLGSYWHFQDLLGVGLEFGDFQLSYHFLHYSNASIVPPNQGIDVNTLLTLSVAI